MNKHYFSPISFLLVLFSSFTFAQVPQFYDNFDSYIANQQLACQNPTQWTTWSNAPCGPEDAYISNAQSFSSPNSVVIVQNNDLVRVFANYTTGLHSVRFMKYIPAGKIGYFNILHLFNGAISQWGLECYFNADGVGVLNAGAPQNFTWVAGQWVPVEVKINLDSDQAEFLYNNVSVYTWIWHLGSNGTGTLNQLGGVDFYGGLATNEMYVDDFSFNFYLVPVESNSFIAPLTFALNQNYPNPFNPSTKISYSIAQAGNVKLAVYNTLGQEIAILVNSYQEANHYEVNFDASNLPAGAYFLRIETPSFTDTKKMMASK